MSLSNRSITQKEAGNFFNKVLVSEISLLKSFGMHFSLSDEFD